MDKKQYNLYERLSSLDGNYEKLSNLNEKLRSLYQKPVGKMKDLGT